jgi:hypothetical protein
VFCRFWFYYRALAVSNLGFRSCAYGL